METVCIRIALAIQQLRFSRQASSRRSNRVSVRKRQNVDQKSASREAYLQTPHVPRAGVMPRSGWRGQLAELGGRRGERRPRKANSRRAAREMRRVPHAPHIAELSQKRVFFRSRSNRATENAMMLSPPRTRGSSHAVVVRTDFLCYPVHFQHKKLNSPWRCSRVPVGADPLRVTLTETDAVES